MEVKKNYSLQEREIGEVFPYCGMLVQVRQSTASCSGCVNNIMPGCCDSETFDTWCSGWSRRDGKNVIYAEIEGREVRIDGKEEGMKVDIIDN